MAAAPNSAVRVCIQCGATGIHGYKYCSVVCRDDHRRHLHGITPIAKVRAAQKALRQRTCRTCGVAFFEGKRSAKQIAEGQDQQFCSYACRSASTKLHENKAAAKRVQYERLRLRRGLPPIPEDAECERCGASFRPRQHTARRCPECASTGSRAKAQYRCLCCGAMYDYQKTGGMPRMVCSDQCATELRKAHKKRSKLIRKGRLRLPGSETVIAFRVLERDGWRCVACGRPTPKAARGTCADDAPEIDHIVPLARGGAHSYVNTQCLCRSCNASKGSGMEGRAPSNFSILGG